jgi:integrase
MLRDQIIDGFWQMPGRPIGDWPGTKNGRDHRVALSEAAQGLIEIHLADKSSASKSSALMKKLVSEFDLERATPHDLRRTCLSAITRLEFGRDAMDRIANHRKGGITDVYDRHSYGGRGTNVIM